MHVFPDCVSFNLPRMLCNVLGHFGCVVFNKFGFAFMSIEMTVLRVLIAEKLRSLVPRRGVSLGRSLRQFGVYLNNIQSPR